MPTESEATLILGELCRGDPTAAQRLLPLIYAELRALAGNYFKGQPSDHTLQPTALVHEAYLRLINQPTGSFNDRAHFFAVAATAMRQILMDSARRRRAIKRGGKAGDDAGVTAQRVSLDAAESPQDSGREIDLVALDDVLTKLDSLDSRKHRIVELRFFGGLTMEQIADVLELSKTTIETEWRATRAWLAMELER